MSYEEFRKRIDTARQILVGAVPSPAGQIDQITYALMYKFMNDIDDQSRALDGKPTYFTGDYAKYNWHELMKPGLEAHEQLELYRQAIQGMNKNPGLPPLFREIYQNAFLPFNSPSVLRLFLNEINKFDHGDSDDIGDAYEYLLSITGAQGDVGQFRTPRHIIKFIVEAVNPTKNDTVLDPAVGTAGFLIAAYNHVKAQHDGRGDQGNANDEKRLTADELEKLHHNYRGFDIDPTMVRTASVNLYLHGFTSPDIRNHDSLSSEDYWNDKYDVVLANPPFMTPKGGIQPHKKFSISANRAEVLFVDYIASHLKPNGRAGVIVPEGIIFQSGKAYKELRKHLIENYLYAVVSLPSGVFMPYTGVKTSILLFDRRLARERDEVIFIDITHTGISLGATGKKIDENNLPEAQKVINKFKAGAEIIASDLAFTVPKDEIRSSATYDFRQTLYRKTEAMDSTLKFISLKEITEVTKGRSSSTKTQPGEYELVLTAKDRKTADHFDIVGDGVAVPLISSLGHGKAEVKRIHRVRGKFALANLLCFIQPKDVCVLDPNFLYYVLDAAKIKLAKLMSGAANVSMNIMDVGEFKIPLPPIEVQREIVAELDGYQKIVDAAKTIVKSHRPVINMHSDWPLKTILQVADMNPQKSEIKGLDGNTKVSFVPMAQLSETTSDFTEQEARALKDVFKGYTYFKNGDVLLAKVTPCFENGKSGIAKNLSNGIGFGSSEFYVLRPKDGILPEIIYYFISNRDFIKRGVSYMTGTGGLQRLTKEYVLNTTVPVPPIETQREIVTELKAEQELVDANKKLIEIYQQKIKSKLAEIWGE